MRVRPVETDATPKMREHSHHGCGAGRHLACRFPCRRGRLLAPQAGSLCYYSTRTAPSEMHRAYAFLPRPAFRRDPRPAERSNARVFLIIDWDYAKSFQIIHTAATRL